MTQQKSRIAMMVNTLSNGGTERVVSNLSRLLSERYDIDIILNDTGTPSLPYCGRIITLGMPVGKERTGTSYQLIALIRRIRLIKKLKKERHYSAVLSFSELTNLTNVLAREKNGKTASVSIISFRNAVNKSIHKGWKYRFFAKWIIPFCLKHADKTVSCSGEIECELISEYGLSADRSYVIYNGLDMDLIRKQTLELLPEEDKLWMSGGNTIISVGRLTVQKGHWHLIRVVNHLRAEGMNVKLIILGEGELRNKLEILIKKLIPGGGVLLRGYVRNPWAYVARADVVVFPSLYEGFSNAIIEAIACGSPVISTDHETGAREILAPDSDFLKKVTDRIDHAEYGVLTPVFDGKFYDADIPLTPEEIMMADAIREMLTDHELTAGYRDAAVKRAAELDIHSIADQWIRLIESNGR